jgi:hypothetical protein
MGLPDLLTTSGSGCPICTGDCLGFPENPHPHDYPFLPGGIDHMAQEPQEYVTADRRVDDPEQGRAVYGVGDRVPMADAVKYGLVDPPQKQPAKAARARKPAADRAKKPAEDRARKPGRNR